MDNTTIGIIGFGAMLVLMFLGVPIGGVFVAVGAALLAVMLVGRVARAIRMAIA